MRFARLLQLLAVAIPIAAAGCTGSDVLSTGNTDFGISIEITNPETRHDFALFSISALNLRPNDPAADEALGDLPIGVLVTAEDVLEIDLNDLGQFEPTAIVLSAGSYRVSSLEFSNLIFVDFDAPIPPSDCTELIDYPPLPPIRLTAADLGEEANISVGAGGEGFLTVLVDGAVFVDAFEAAWNCNLSTGRATSFRTADFRAAAQSFLRLE